MMMFFPLLIFFVITQYFVVYHHLCCQIVDVLFVHVCVYVVEKRIIITAWWTYDEMNIYVYNNYSERMNVRNGHQKETHEHA